jgi:hypothetical protein
MMFSHILLANIPAPTQLLVDLQTGTASSTPTLARSAKPTFSFVPEAEAEAAVPPRKSTMTAYRIGVYEAATKALVWDSGKTPSNNATAVECSKALFMGSYSFEAMWWDSSDTGSPLAHASFDVGPLTEVDWAGAAWYGGGGQRELRVQLPPLANGSLARLFVASPGGTIVSVNGAPVGDAYGISAWTDFGGRVMYEARALDGLLLAGQGNEVTVAMGCGFYCSAGGGAKDPVARLLYSTAGADGTTRRLGAQGLSVEGRAGRVKSDSPKLGTHTDWRVGPGDGWAPAKQASVFGKATLAPLATPAAEARAAPAGQKVTDLGGGSWLYKLPINLVGSLVVAAGAYAGPGTLTVHHCERLNASAATPTCAALSGLQALP